MSETQSRLDRLLEAIGRALPENLSDDVRRNVKATVRAACENMDLVTREELEVQQAVLLRTREKVEQLEKQVLELENKVMKN